MKHKMIGKLHLAICWIAILQRNVSTAKPLDPEDLEGLLPPTPRDKNETIAAVVQDPVVQDAVHQAASNSSLNGLVVKKKVYLLPATDPNKVLSTREHLLVVPTENLEDVRMNITEAKRAEEAVSIELTSPENQSLFERDANGYTPENGAALDYENGPTQTTNQLPYDDTLRSKTEFLKDKLSNVATSPEDDSKKVAVPIVAVIDPSNAEKGKVNSPIVAILPNQLNGAALTNQVQFLKDNGDQIQTKAQSYIDGTSLTVDPVSWQPSTHSSEVASSTQGMLLAPDVASRWEMVGPLFEDDGAKYPRQTGDMDVAEDIIFRPLFRYRQETQERSRYNDDTGNRRYGYPGYGYYSRRGYPYGSRYDDY
ncbi:uncharacterized protein LOC122395128 [Colletes gigas]|uniref:uncharacterized protein LOC122395128 n=1 Tax=Colletes gigas TaxID=935657 RepID=UPI001C9B3E2C|nr:uncharacterized protein LOC122395128 [Colletes gigas]